MGTKPAEPHGLFYSSAFWPGPQISLTAHVCMKVFAHRIKEFIMSGLRGTFSRSTDLIPG